MSKFPPSIIVFYDEGDTTRYLLVSDDIAGIPDGRRVAIYKLAHVKTKRSFHSLVDAPARRASSTKRRSKVKGER